MNWIKITEDTKLPTESRVFVREKTGRDITYFAGTIYGNLIELDEIGRHDRLTDYTHYMLIEDAKD